MTGDKPLGPSHNGSTKLSQKGGFFTEGINLPQRLFVLLPWNEFCCQTLLVSLLSGGQVSLKRCDSHMGFRVSLSFIGQVPSKLRDLSGDGLNLPVLVVALPSGFLVSLSFIGQVPSKLRELSVEGFNLFEMLYVSST